MECSALPGDRQLLVLIVGAQNVGGAHSAAEGVWVVAANGLDTIKAVRLGTRKSTQLAAHVVIPGHGQRVMGRGEF